MARWTGVPLFLAVSLVALWGCNADVGPASKAAAEKPTENRPGRAATSAVKRIVFVDEEECCECARTRRKATWESLQVVLGRFESPPVVEVVHLDVDADIAEAYTAMQPLMVTPGLYFFDDEDTLLGLLQGELTAEQIAGELR